MTEPEPVWEYFEIQGEALEEFQNLPQAGATSACRPSLFFWGGLGEERFLGQPGIRDWEIKEQREGFGAEGGNPGRVWGTLGKILWEIPIPGFFLEFFLGKGGKLFHGVTTVMLEGSFFGKIPGKAWLSWIFPFKRSSGMRLGTEGMAIQGFNL